MESFEERLKEILSHTYDIERELGGGGMSRVFVAIDRGLGRKVVIKLLSPDLVADVNRGRFRREIQVAAQLQHPHIVPLLSAGEHEDLVWYTMPFIAGESLRSKVEKNGAMTVPDVVRVMYQVGEALDYAHGEGVIHRDIKAANILLSGSYALITDFGVAKALNASMPASGMTQTGTAIGTPAYMAPEQLAGDPAADHRIDIYAVGLLAYELLNGRSPFAATTPAKVLVAVLSENPKPLVEVRPDVPASLSDLVMRCLSKEPDERPGSARMLLNALDAFSTASGEIRTMEHRIPRAERPVPFTRSTPLTGTTPVSTTGTGTMSTTAPGEAPTTPTDTPITGSTSVPTSEPLSASDVPALAPTLSVDLPGSATPTTPVEPSTAEIEAVGYVPPKKDRTRMIAAVVAVLVLIAAGAFFMSQRSGNQAATVAAAPAPPAVLATDSASLLPPPAVANSAAIAPVPAPAVVAIDSQAVKDSIRKAKAAAAKIAAAKADSLKKADSVKRAAAAKADSAKKVVQDPVRTRARSAAAGLLANAEARAAFARGATHKGGLLGSKTKGDLQTQIDALMPFLRGAGLTYEQFKDAVKGAGVTLFDAQGRMIQDSLARFAGGR
jgi:serine/threonine-protein kinase